MLNLAGFHCWAEPEAGDISIVLSQRELDKYKIRDSTLTGAVLASPAADTAKGRIIPFGQSRITIKRQGEQTVSFTLNLERPSGALIVSQSCHAAIPAVAAIPPAPPAPKVDLLTPLMNVSWCLSSTVGGTQSGPGVRFKKSGDGVTYERRTLHVGAPDENGAIMRWWSNYSQSQMTAGQFDSYVGMISVKPRDFNPNERLVVVLKPDKASFVLWGDTKSLSAPNPTELTREDVMNALSKQSASFQACLTQD
jgi:hypothetical protein